MSRRNKSGTKRIYGARGKAMKTTIDRHRARLERARKRVEAADHRYGSHECPECGGYEWCSAKLSLYALLYEAMGRRKEAESVLREARRHG